MTAHLDELRHHVTLAAKVIEAWERKAPTGSLEDTLRMISEEIATLESIHAAHPGKIDHVEDLAERFRAMRRSLVS